MARTCPKPIASNPQKLAGSKCIGTPPHRSLSELHTILTWKYRATQHKNMPFSPLSVHQVLTYTNPTLAPFYSDHV